MIRVDSAATGVSRENPNMSLQDPVTLPQIAMIHTVSGLIPLFDGLAKQHLPQWQGFNMLDESLLRDTIRDGALSQTTMWRLAQMAHSAVDAGASAIVVTCSSLGPAVDAAKLFCPVPLFRIDEGMAEAAVKLGLRVGVLATLRTTLDPTSNLIRHSAAQQGRPCTVIPDLAEGAFQKLGAGDVAGHDAMVAQSLRDLAPKADVIVLAQASMARALALVQDELHPLPVLTSPELGMQHIARQLLR
jgi:Asp/Glu/hydantoin racemase